MAALGASFSYVYSRNLQGSSLPVSADLLPLECTSSRSCDDYNLEVRNHQMWTWIKMWGALVIQFCLVLEACPVLEMEVIASPYHVSL